MRDDLERGLIRRGRGYPDSGAAAITKLAKFEKTSRGAPYRAPTKT